MGWTDKVVDAAIGWLVQSILGSFFTQQMQVWAEEIGLTEDVAMLESEMKSVQMVLAAAEGRRIDNVPLSDALDELKDLLYDAEDVMDELDYYRLQQQIEWKCSSAAASNPEGSCASSSTPSYIQNFSWVMQGKKRKREQEEPTYNTVLPVEIKHDISERINAIVKHLRIRGKSVQEALQLELLRQIAMPKQSRSEPRKPRQTTSLPTERKVYGRDAERDNIIKLLMKGKPNDIGVLALVGVGGVGKTTLARFVYHDQRIKDHFDLRMWVCVSDNFSEKRLTHEILEHVCKDRQKHENIANFDVLQKTLLKENKSKRFLLVLDDMWEDRDMDGWNNLLATLKHNEANGCMILVTTRRASVAKMIGTMSRIEVNGLDEEEFWLLFKEWAFFGSEIQEHNPTLQSIGKQIAKELTGNPLAARSVGALLNRSVNFEHWRKVQHKWKSFVQHDNGILAILKFSYDYLPVHLQRCFAYCSLFPKDHQFTEEKLVHSWISQNFVKFECYAERLEETGKQYLDNLVDWGFFEEVESYYVMHDLMHDLAEKVSSNECATVDGLESKKISQNVRHLSIITNAYDMEKHCNFPLEKFENTLHNAGTLQKLRTLMFFGESSTMLLRSLHTLCKESKRLRVLRIYVTSADIISTHNLLKPYHLRYLEFIVVRTRNIAAYNASIPHALTQFYHLQVLDASSPGNLIVPTGMNNLIKLRHLIAHEKVHSTIASVGDLSSLQELKFKVQDAGNFNIGQLGSMNELVTLGISRLDIVKTKEEAKSARLIDKEQLEVLSLSWDDNRISPEPTEERTRDDVLEGLEPHQNLKQLELSQYSGATSPTWLASKVTSLQVLHLEKCREWRIVQSLEMLPVLRKLKLTRMWNLVEVSIPPYLEELVIVNTPKLERCVGTYGQDLTSRLKVLMVKDCPHLNEFTLLHSDHFLSEQKSWFPSLSKLTIGHCHRIIAWKILPLEEMRALKELELMDVPIIEELLVPPLEKLALIQMPSLQSCSGITATPSLQILSSQGNQKDWLSTLRKLTIHDCPSLIVSHPIPPSPLISYLSVKGLPTLPTMELNQREFTIKSNGLSELDARILPFHNLRGLKSVFLQHCPNLTCISSDGFSQLIALEDLVTEQCPNLLQPHVMSEPVYENSTPNSDYLVLPSLKKLSILSCGIAGRWLSQTLPHLQSLECLYLRDCPQIKQLLISQPVETEATSAGPGNEHLLQIPCNILRSLKKLFIWECPDLEFCGVNEGFGGFASLVDLSINCPKLVSSLVNETLDNGLLPKSLEYLEITDLPANLQSFFPRGLPYLKVLFLCIGPCLKSVQLGSCTALEHLNISAPQLGALEGLQHLSSLRRLSISMKPQLCAAWDLNLQEQGGNLQLEIPNLPSSITNLWVRNSPNLESLQLGYCTALEVLAIDRCESLASIEGLHSITNLRFLRLIGTPRLAPWLQLVSQQQGASGIWSRLETLEINDASVLSTPLCMHLTSLLRLVFFCPEDSWKGMVCLTEEQERALRLLTSLRRLYFHFCWDLESLPSNLGSLDSLEELHISECPKILRLPEMGLPPSLKHLYLSDCSEELCLQSRMAETDQLRVSESG